MVYSFREYLRLHLMEMILTKSHSVNPCVLMSKTFLSDSADFVEHGKCLLPFSYPKSELELYLC